MSHSFWRTTILALCWIAGAARGAVAAAPPAPTAGTEAEGDPFFTRQVKPILQSNCVSCHSGDQPTGGLRLTSREAILKGGASGPAVSLAKPGESLLLAAVNYRGRRMPPAGKLPQAQLDVLTRWVTMGAPWPSGPEASLEPGGQPGGRPGGRASPRLAPPAHAGPPQVTPETMRFWSFQPVRRPLPPAVKRQGWARSPVDAFVLKRLTAAGLAPNPPASRTALIRRAYYDLTGLPPSPEAVQAFLADRSPNAWEKVVDGLLASPQYGEKWGRHWLDLVRYAESNSYERDGTKPNVWRYRDYVIRSFNQDKPYDQFIREQLAGDELTPRTPEGLIATGFYRLGIWDDEPADEAQALYDDLDDIASTTSQVFLGLTLNCARCHDHKLDPIPQKDYYRFLAFFAGVQRYGGPGRGTSVKYSLQTIATEAEQQKQRAAIAAHDAKVQENEEQIAAIEKRVDADLTPEERGDFTDDALKFPILEKRIPALLSREEFNHYIALTEEREALKKFQPPPIDMALCVTELGRTPRETHVLLRGNPHVEGEKVEPGFPSVLAPPPPLITVPASGGGRGVVSDDPVNRRAEPTLSSPYSSTCGRRLALARWIASERNPLTARVIVNRLWQYHFGRGIVRSPNNFGLQGDKPTHPELLDWLASELVAHGWKLKPIHRLIMLSATYRMASRASPRALAKDPENNLLWRFDMRRLEAEEIRDSLLAVNGSLNLAMGGPSIYPTLPAEVLAGQSRPGDGWGQSPPELQRRRSVYIFVKRSLVMPIIASFDGPETDLTCPARFATTQPTQALGMLNSAFVNDQAKVFAAYLRRRAGDRPADQVRLGLWRTLQRPPAPAEIERGVKLIASLQKEETMSAADALADFCVVAFNLNEFMYLD